MTNEEAVQRANRVRQIVDDPLVAEAWEAVRNRLRDIMEAANTDEATLKAKTCLGLLADVRQQWERVMTEGKVAAERIEFEQRQRKWWRRAA